ncbi:hypothetical protein QJS66_00380 [Kocuria rhizophila]|nr:hypothetical protein QJS66_00380 [Kocuria rhizophila]
MIALVGRPLCWRSSAPAVAAAALCAAGRAAGVHGSRCAAAPAARIAKSRRSTEILSILSRSSSSAGPDCPFPWPPGWNACGPAARGGPPCCPGRPGRGLGHSR